MTIRVLEMAAKLNIDINDLLAMCVLLDIPATSPISCLSLEDVEKISAHYHLES